MWWISGRRRLERGASALEMAFVAPGLIAIIFFGIQGALFFYGRNVAIQAAREGVSQLRVAQTPTMYDDMRGDVVEGTQRFARAVGREALIDPVASPTYEDGGADRPARVTMTVTGRVITLLPGLHLTVTQHAEGPVERWGTE
jgi:hypothetical protein